MRCLAIVTFCLLATGVRLDAQPAPIRVLLIDGQNNHRWQETSPLLASILEDSGRFRVERATTPENPGEATAWGAFRPPFEQADVILLNYNGPAWPEATHAALEQAVDSGKGLVVVHAANNAFPGRREYDRLLGLGWRLADQGVRLEIDGEGKITRIPSGSGPGAGHGERHEFLVRTFDMEHPITRGLPREWRHVRDELYHGLRGPANDMTILATAFSDPATGGTGFHEPVAWTVSVGKGRIFHLTLGHDVSAMRCVGFQTLLVRGTEWAASGEVTLPVPDDFPTDSRVRTRDLWDLTRRPLVRAIAAAALVLLAGFFWIRRRFRKGKPV